MTLVGARVTIGAGVAATNRDERQKDDCEFGGEHCYTRRVSGRRILGEVEQVLVCTVEFEGLYTRWI